MPEIFRTRDTIIFRKGDGTAYRASPGMAASGWAGGQGVQWFDSGEDDFAVELTDGDGVGFALWGSDEDSDKFTAMTLNQPTYEFVVVGLGGWFISTTSYEQFTLASRTTPPLVPLVYAPQDRLRFSLRGLWTKEDEWTISGDGRAPNEFLNGVVAQIPSALNDNYLSIHTF